MRENNVDDFILIVCIDEAIDEDIDDIDYGDLIEIDEIFVDADRENRNVDMIVNPCNLVFKQMDQNRLLLLKITKSKQAR